jgi:nitrilase
VLPETFVPLYPNNTWAWGATTFDGRGELWERLWHNSVDVPGAAPSASRRPAPSSTPSAPQGQGARDGTAGDAPTMHERLFHGLGDGRDLRAVDTPIARSAA